MAGESAEMDSLFEGMDFVMTLENDNQFVADGDLQNPLTNKLEAKEVVHPEVSNPNQSPTANPTLVLSSASLDPTSSLSSGPADLGLSFRSASTSIPSQPPSQPPSRALSPTPASVSVNHGDQHFRDNSEPLDESLFSGLTQTVLEDETVTELNPPSTNGEVVQKTIITTGIPTTIDNSSKEYTSTDSVQHARSGSFDDPSSGGVRGSNADKDGWSAESTMPVYNDGSPYSSSGGKHLGGGTVPISRTNSGFGASTPSPPVKPAMRRKKRSMKIGYGREDEENEELGLRKAGIREAFGAALLGKDAVVDSSSTSSPRPVYSRESSNNALSVDESTLASVLGDSSPLNNGGELPKSNSTSRLSSGSQYSFLEVDGIERVESRDVSREIIAAQLEFDKPEVISKESFHAENEEQHSSDKDQSHGSPVEETRSDVDVEVASEPPRVSLKEIEADQVPSEPPRWDPEDTVSIVEKEGEKSVPDEDHEEGVGTESEQDHEEEDLYIEPLAQPIEGTIEERMEFVKEAVAHTLKALLEKMSAVSALRKTAVQKRRRAAEKVAAAVDRHKELEAELNAACEREDFEKADSLSGMIAEAETSLAQAGEAFALAEAESDSASSKVQDVLDWQVAIEEQGATFLEMLKQEAEDAGERTLKEAQEIAGREAERLEAEENAIELRKSKLDLELSDAEKAKEELDKAIGDLTQSESKEKAALTGKRGQFSVELEDLLRLVRMKEAEIAECDERIADVDEKINTVAATFESQKASLDAQLETIATTAINLGKDSNIVSEGRQGIEQLLTDAEEKRARLENSAKIALDAGKAMRDAVKIKKAVALSMMQSRRKRTELAEKEKQAQAEAQLVRQNAASTRVLLQELTSSKVKLSQELGAVKERITFAEKRTNELDAEKKLAAAARNFKVAGRLAAEVKVLNAEKESASAELARFTKELETVEGEAKVKLLAQADLDNLIAAKERDGAMAHCERLRLVAAAARDERDVALELDDFEEAESLDGEAKAADAEAATLQRLYELVGSNYESQDLSNSGDAVTNAVSKDVSNGDSKEAAMVECERLRQVAAAAREEMDAAAERDQFDEAEALQHKAEIADAEADNLRKLHQLEGRQFDRITNTSEELNANEDLDLKDKESAMADCERLRLLAATARDERDTAVELDQFEEAEAFDSKAEAADAEADRLQELFQLEGRQYERQENAKTKTSPE
ncbi:unnamed protein product [Calypogeia fissa]